MGRLFLRQLLFIHGSWGRIVWLHLWLLFIHGSWGWVGRLLFFGPAAGWRSWLLAPLLPDGWPLVVGAEFRSLCEAAMESSTADMGRTLLTEAVC